MAENFFLISLLFIAVASCRSTYQTARRVEQSLVDRSTYLGGWPLAAVPCPSDASVACDTGISSQINQQCCPSGNTCFSWPATIPPVCCPSSQNCVGQLQNLPVCANSTWNMYELITFGSTNYFCCEQGQVGVIPTAGYAGICQAQGQAVPSSLLATLINQVGAATAAGSSNSPTGTGTTGINSTSISPITATSTSDGFSSVAPSSSGTSSTSLTSNNKTSSGSMHLASGAIAGITIGGALVIAALIFVLWKSCTRKYRSRVQQPPIHDTVPEGSFQPGSPAVNVYKASPIVGAQQVYQQAPRANEVSGENRYAGRAEMET